MVRIWDTIKAWSEAGIFLAFLAACTLAFGLKLGEVLEHSKEGRGSTPSFFKESATQSIASLIHCAFGNV